jgi:TatD DNase family protein
MIDSHCHLDSKVYNQQIEPLLAQAKAAGVHTIVTIGTDMDSSEKTVAIAAKQAMVYATVGIHPHDATTCSDTALARLRELAGKPKVVAIGEIGLDYYRDMSPRPVQKKAFAQQLDLAVELKMPVVIHTREAFEDTLEIVKPYAKKLPGGVFHCFPGSADDAAKVFDLGFVVSVGGVITFPKSSMSAMVTQVPLDKVILETDSPYLTPVPHRGKTNVPAYVSFVADTLASLRGISKAEVVKITDRTCRKLYRLEETFGG